MDWYKWYPAIYEADTAHLTAEQDGIYRRLIDRYMQTRQPLPDNDNALARHAGISLDSWCHASAIVRAYFRHSEGKLYHNFCDDILKDQDNSSKTKSKIGKLGAEKRWKKTKQNQQIDSTSHASAIAKAMQEERRGEDKEYIGLPDFIPINLWSDFVTFRKSLKAPFTKQAEKVNIGKLVDLDNRGFDVSYILRETVASGWKSFYEPKDGKGRKVATTDMSNPYGDLML